MALFENHHYGRTISPELSERLLIYSTLKDRTEISEKTGVGIETLNRVARAKSPLTKRNSKAVIELARVAFQKALKSREFANKTVEDLGEYFK